MIGSNLMSGLTHKYGFAGRAIAVGAFAVAITVGSFSNEAAAKELSDKSVKVLMDYAWSILPAKFTTPKGKTIIVDKKKRDKIIVPINIGRGVAKVARLSAHAQICDLPEAQAANYRTMMRFESRRKKWSEQQMLYISQLHLFTVMWLTGNVKLVEKDGEKTVELENSSNRKAPTCTENQRRKVSETIGRYVIAKQKEMGIHPKPKKTN